MRYDVSLNSLEHRHGLSKFLQHPRQLLLWVKRLLFDANCEVLICPFKGQLSDGNLVIDCTILQDSFIATKQNVIDHLWIDD